MGPNGLVLTLLVFGSLSYLTADSSSQPKQQQRMLAMYAALYEMALYAAEQRIMRAHKSKIPPAPRYKLTPDDLILVYREGPRKWVGLVEVVKVEKHLVHVSDGVKLKSFSMTQVMPNSIGHRALDEDLQRIFEYNDRVYEAEKLQQEEMTQLVQLTEILTQFDPSPKTVSKKQSYSVNSR